MRRVLLGAAIALAIPAAAVAFTTNPGQLIESTNFNATTGASYVNAAMCATTSPVQLQLQWTISPSTGAFGQNDSYNIVASNTAPGSDGFCPADQATTSVHSKQIGSVSATTANGTTTVNAADVATATQVPCTTASEKTIVYLCVHWVDSGGNKKGVAKGNFIMQLVAPTAPTGVGVNPGSSKLVVNWTANPTTPTETDHYTARAFTNGAAADATPVSTATTNSGATTTATIQGLANDTPYDVDVIAYSLGGNPSPPSTPRLTASPVPTADFWTVYKDRGGQEQGGCGGGPGGLVSLLGLAALGALRRRNP
jgi:MYXO-CTERM domain-containing protein